MDAPAPAFDPQLLAQQLAFVRRLARGLAGGADAADELAARTVAAAWAQRPETGVAFRGWLRRVAQRLMRREREADARRLAREQAVARPEATPPADELAAQLELTRRITAALEALDEPFRRTLFERYFLDRAPSAIAAASGVPLATVKSRLARGLEQLRRRLDVVHGGRRDGWMAAIVPWIGGPAIVATKTKALPLAVAALLIASGSVALVQPWKGVAADEETREAPIAVAAAEGGGAQERGTAAERGAASDRGEAVVGRAVREALPREPAAPPFTAGVVVDEQGAAIAGVNVVANRLGLTDDAEGRLGMAGLDLSSVAEQRVAISDAEGRFAVAEPGDLLGSLHFVKEGFAAVEVHDLAADAGDRQALRVVLPRQREIRGVVRDSEGRPIPRARMGVGAVVESGEPWITRVARHLPDAPRYVACATFLGQMLRADDDGRFAFLSLPAARFTVGASATGYLHAGELDQHVGSTWEPRLVRSDALFDLTDAKSGAPIEQAALLLLDAETGDLLRRGVNRGYSAGGDVPPGRHFVPLGIGERFAVLPEWLDERRGGGPRTVVVHVAAVGYAAASLRLDLDAKREPPHVAIALARDDGGVRPIAIGGTVNRAARLGLHLLHPDESPDGVDRRKPLLETASAPDGRFAFRDLPRARWLLVARADGCATWSRVVESPDDAIEVALEEEATLEVAVLDGDGAPVAGATVLLQRLDGDGRRAWRGEGDDEGLVRFPGLPSGRFDLAAFEVGADEVARDDSVDAERGRGVASWPFDDSCFADGRATTVEAGATARVEATLIEPVAVELQLVTPDGQPATAARLLGGSALEGPHFALLDDAAARKRLMPAVGDDGVARMELWPGRYSLEIAAGGVKEHAEVAVPRATSYATTVTVRAPLPSGEWRGRLVELGSGRPIAFRDVELHVSPGGGRSVSGGTATTDRDGRFAFAAAPAGAGLLYLHADERSSGGRGGVPDLESRWPAAQRKIEIAVKQPGVPVDEVVIELPAIRGADGSVATLPCRIEVVDADSRAPLPGTNVMVRALLGDVVIDLAKWKSDDHGRAEGRLWDAPRYRLFAGVDQGYRTAVIELEPQDGAVVATIELTRLK